jgi:hypothetical protein
MGDSSKATAHNAWADLREWFASLSQLSRLSIPLVAIAVCFGFIEFIVHLRDAREIATSVLRAGISVDPANAKLEVQPWLVVALFLLIVLNVSFLLLWIQAERRRANDKTIRTLRGVMRAAGHICNRLFPLDHASQVSIEEAHSIYNISNDFTTRVRRVYRVRAGDSPLYFLERGFRVREHADSIKELIDIDFQVRDTQDPNGVVYLPVTNEGRNKSVCVFFLPRIERQQTREIEISYQWPRMLRGLRIDGEEEFSLRHKSSSLLKDFSMSFYMEPGTGGHLVGEESGPAIPHREILFADSQLKWPGIRYAGKEIPIGVLAHGIRFRLRWRLD